MDDRQKNNSGIAGRERYSVTQLARASESRAAHKIVIAGHWRGRRGSAGQAVALWFGEYETDPKNHAELREKWIFLPFSQVETMGNGLYAIPAWLAVNRDLMRFEAGHEK